MDFYSSPGMNTVPYDNILLNHGEAYNSETYTFMAPVRGLYWFTVSMGPIERGRVDIIVNDVARLTACDHARSIHWESGDSTSAILHLEVGGTVLIAADGELMHSHGGGVGRNSFSGFLYAEL